MSNNSSSTRALHQAVVYLRSFLGSTAEDKLHVEASISTLLRKKFDANELDQLDLTFSNPEAFLEALSDESSELASCLRPCDGSEMFSSIKSCVEADFVAELEEQIEQYGCPRQLCKFMKIGVFIDEFPDLKCDRVKLSTAKNDRALIDIGFFHLLDGGEAELTWCSVPESTRVKAVIKAFAAEVGVSLNSVWFSWAKKQLFLSNLGSRTVVEHFLHGHVVFVKRKRETRTPLKALDNTTVHVGRSQKKKVVVPKRKSKKCNVATELTRVKEVGDEELRKKDLRSWMDKMYSVFAEAEPLFKRRREKIHELGLKRTMPKLRKKTTVPLFLSPDRKVSSIGLGSKAGKSCFVVRVGDEANLYKTTKSSKIVGRSSTNDIITIDLHSFTREEALDVLDGFLPGLIDTAMKGSYPWVITVKIVCGCGAQVLAETVEKWIRESRHVCHAPKSIYH